MTRGLVAVLFAAGAACAVVWWISLPTVGLAVAADSSGRLLESLPAATLAAVELSAPAAQLDPEQGAGRMLADLFAGRCPDRAPSLEPWGGRAVVALLPAPRDELPFPVVLLGSARAGGEEEGLLVRCSPLFGEAGGVVLPVGGARWIVPASEAEAAARLAARAGGGFVEGARVEEGVELLETLLPGTEFSGSAPSLAQAWINPPAVREWLEALRPWTEGGLPDLLRSLGAAKADAVELATLRRWVEGGDLMGAGVFRLDRRRVPAAVLDAFAGSGVAPPLPEELPPRVAATVAFADDPELWLAWLRYVAADDPRGPFRQVEFHLRDIERRFGVKLAEEIPAAFHGDGYLLVLEGPGEMYEPVLALRTRDPERARQVADTIERWALGTFEARTLFTGRFLVALAGQEAHLQRRVSGEHLLLALTPAGLNRAAPLLEEFTALGPAPDEAACRLLFRPAPLLPLEGVVTASARIEGATLRFKVRGAGGVATGRQ